MSSPSPQSRRAFLSGFLNPLKSAAAQQPRDSKPVPQPSAPASLPPTMEDSMAIVVGRHCLAVTNECRVCLETCPVAGAMKLDGGMPMVVSAACTGCRICHDLCPAPTRAILMVPRPAGVPRPLSSPPPWAAEE